MNKEIKDFLEALHFIDLNIKKKTLSEDKLNAFACLTDWLHENDICDKALFHKQLGVMNEHYGEIKTDDKYQDCVLLFIDTLDQNKESWSTFSSKVQSSGMILPKTGVLNKFLLSHITVVDKRSEDITVIDNSAKQKNFEESKRKQLQNELEELRERLKTLNEKMSKADKVNESQVEALKGAKDELERLKQEAKETNKKKDAEHEQRVKMLEAQIQRMQEQLKNISTTPTPPPTIIHQPIVNESPSVPYSHRPTTSRPEPLSAAHPHNTIKEQQWYERWYVWACAAIIAGLAFFLINGLPSDSSSKVNASTEAVIATAISKLEGNYSLRETNNATLVNGIRTAAIKKIAEGQGRIVVVSEYDPLIYDFTFTPDGHIYSEELGKGEITYKQKFDKITLTFKKGEQVCEFTK